MTRLLALSLVLAACSAAPDLVPPNPAATIALAPDGLRIVNTTTGSTRLVPFGTAEADALVAIGPLVAGVATRSENTECGAGPTQFAAYPDGLQLAFQDGAFAGWWLDTPEGAAAPVLSTMDGLGIGITRDGFDDLGTLVTVEETTVGTEFAAGEIYGLLSGPEPAARVTDLWAGVSCIFR